MENKKPKIALIFGFFDKKEASAAFAQALKVAKIFASKICR